MEVTTIPELNFLLEMMQITQPNSRAFQVNFDKIPDVELDALENAVNNARQNQKFDFLAEIDREFARRASKFN